MQARNERDQYIPTEVNAFAEPGGEFYELQRCGQRSVEHLHEMFTFLAGPGHVADQDESQCILGEIVQNVLGLQMLGGRKN